MAYIRSLVNRQTALIFLRYWTDTLLRSLTVVLCSGTDSGMQGCPDGRRILYVQEIHRGQEMAIRYMCTHIRAHTIQTSLLKVRRVVVLGAGVVAAQDRGDLDGRGQGRGKARALPGRAGAGVGILAKQHTIGTLIARIPDFPAGTVDDVADGSLLEDHAGVLTPGSAEVVSAAGDSGT